MRASPSQEGRAAAERVLEVPVAERAERARELRFEHPEVLLALCEALTRRIETAPAVVAEDAEFFYGFLARPVRKIGEFDEREYFLGELALLAGGANRILFRRDDARRWFDRAESNFVRVANASVHFARLAYQKLALAMEERRFDEVLELAPVWSESSRKLGSFRRGLEVPFPRRHRLPGNGRLPEGRRGLPGGLRGGAGRKRPQAPRARPQTTSRSSTVFRATRRARSATRGRPSTS